MADMRALASPTDQTPAIPTYDDSQLIQSLKGSNPYSSGRVNTLDQYLNQLTPTQLLQRYQSLASQNGTGDYNQFSNNRYGVATAQDQAYYSALKSAKDVLGRDLTPNEFAQLSPIFYNPADPQAGIVAGRQALAALADKDKNSPTNLQAKAPQYADTINGIFQDLNKRGATQDELNHFGSMLASGQIDPYTLRSFVQATPEYQQAQDQKFRGDLNTELQGYDQTAFDRGKQDILSSYSRAGIGNSSALDFALTDLMGKIATNRGQYLANLSASQYGNNKEAARADYQGNLNNYMDNLNNARAQSRQTIAGLTDRGYNAYDYAQQRNDYMNFLNSQPRQRSGGIGPLVGGAIGAGVGSFFPGGTLPGYQIGSGLGGAYNYLNA